MKVTTRQAQGVVINFPLPGYQWEKSHSHTEDNIPCWLHAITIDNYEGPGIQLISQDMRSLLHTGRKSISQARAQAMSYIMANMRRLDEGCLLNFLGRHEKETQDGQIWFWAKPCYSCTTRKILGSFYHELRMLGSWSLSWKSAGLGQGVKDIRVRHRTSGIGLIILCNISTAPKIWQ